MYSLDEHHVLRFLIQVFLLLGLARVLGEILRKYRQAPITAEIIVGILLGPTILGKLSPNIYAALFPPDPLQHAMLETVAWVGVLFLLLETGLEIDCSTVWRQKGDALKISLMGVVVPIVIGFAGMFFLPDRYLVDPQQRVLFALFMATVMAITAMPVVSRVLHDLSLTKSDLGYLIVSAHSVNDLAGWFIFSLLLGFMTTGHFAITQALLTLVAVTGFAVLCFTVGRILTDRAIRLFKSKNLPETSTSLTFICLLGLFCGVVTQSFGIHALFGFFIAGMMAGSAQGLTEKTRHVISHMVFAIFVPLFFASVGLKLDFLNNFDIPLVFLVTFIGIGGKFLGGWLGARLTKLAPSDRMAVAIAHTPGGTMEIVVGVIALENGLISVQIFVAVVFGAIFSSIIFGPWLSWSISKRKGINMKEYFIQRSVISDLQAVDRGAAVLEMCEQASLVGDLQDARVLSDAVLARESVLGTAIEGGVALPHARIAAVKKPMVIFGRSAGGIEWNSPDGKPAQLIFLILVPQKASDDHLKILMVIAKSMKQDEIRQAVLEAKSAQDIWTRLQEALATI